MDMDKDTLMLDAEERMEKALLALDKEFAKLRTGRASTSLVDNIKVDYYGTLTPVQQMSTVSCPDSRTVTIQPWDKGAMALIEKAILNSDLGLNPQNDGKVVRISIPPLTEDRRKALVKQCKGEAENAKVSVRNARRDAIDGLKKAVKQGMSEDVEKDAEAQVQKIHDKYLKKIDDIFAVKEKEILTV